MLFIAFTILPLICSCSCSLALVLNGYFENNYQIPNDTNAIQSVHNLNKSQAKKVIKKASEYIKRKGQSWEIYYIKCYF